MLHDAAVQLYTQSISHKPGATLFAGQMHHLHQNGVAYYAPADGSAQNEGDASAATERMTEDEYADSATHSHGSHGIASKAEQLQRAHNHFATQDRSEEDHTENSSEGTR